ncbi:uncharacterized protein BDR25DRAFT_19691 [Lindgomyces ingoldianus]|uniref:Uncharacterized protein n=1 Tax=Lindgomyces ingoldianus TaxID=673940 RepID=A0ACB6R1D0_9PLEO|nr:uncharacterized protein BDR25DRAFT_19691 [Lindgomyces ingoldianus]KAF2472251.1 hypothetical protein BDR25DRAFT_19691 [Lindgomyces ingoldianus]
MASLPPPIPRFLLPRGATLLRPYPRYPLLPLTQHLRNASSTSNPKPKNLSEVLRQKKPATLAQPDKYRPPSHGKRAPRSTDWGETASKVYGPKPTAEDRERMRTKKYPNMMAPEGTFMHWFLHNRIIHIWITMGTLVTLAIAAWYMDFVSKTPYGDLIPSKKDFLRHPWETSNRFIDVYKMHVAHTSQLAYEKRMKKTEDAEKRKQYRMARIQEAEERGEEYIEDPRYYIGEDGVRRRRVKRWFGIWE